MSVVEVGEATHRPLDTTTEWRLAASRNSWIHVGSGFDRSNSVFNTIFQACVRDPSTKLFIKTAKQRPWIFTRRRAALSFSFNFSYYLFEIVGIRFRITHYRALLWPDPPTA
tara:strand:- start:3504 stop:3839 length:336 start_codon:yes stop_codon:yes gene_type:complete